MRHLAALDITEADHTGMRFLAAGLSWNGRIWIFRGHTVKNAAASEPIWRHRGEHYTFTTSTWEQAISSDVIRCAIFFLRNSFMRTLSALASWLATSTNGFAD